MSKRTHKTARGLAALGRGEDKVLVHMTPREVAGLQKLAVATGGTLTINPKTGLPEAGWLSSILPIVAGGLASVLTGGAAIPMLLAGAAGGGLGAKAEGEDPLMGALGGALGGFGGGSLANLAMGAGTAAAGTAAAQTAASNAAGAGIAGEAGKMAGQNLINSTIQHGINPVASNMAQAGMTNGVQTLATQEAAKTAAQQAAKTAAGSVPATLSNAVPPGTILPAGKEAFMAGIKGLANPAGRSAMMQSFKALPQSQQMGALGAGTSLVTTAAEGIGSSSGGGNKGKKPMYYHTTGDIDPITGRTTFGPGYWSKEYDYANRGMYDPDDEIEDAPTYKKTKYAYGKASGGLVALAKGGRFLRGKGDGVSDSIRAKIESKAKGAAPQAAALSDGEFVIPARHVSELGNGSSDAGAKRLYDMLHRIEQRRKSTAYAADSNARTALPA